MEILNLSLPDNAIFIIRTAFDSFCQPQNQNASRYCLHMLRLPNRQCCGVFVLDSMVDTRTRDDFPKVDREYLSGLVESYHSLYLAPGKFSAGLPNCS